MADTYRLQASRARSNERVAFERTFAEDLVVGGIGMTETDFAPELGGRTVFKDTQRSDRRNV